MTLQYELVVMLSLFQYCQSQSLAISTVKNNDVNPINHAQFGPHFHGFTWIYMHLHAFTCIFRKRLEERLSKNLRILLALFKLRSGWDFWTFPGAAESVSQTLRKVIKPAQDKATGYHEALLIQLLKLQALYGYVRVYNCVYIYEKGYSLKYSIYWLVHRIHDV